MKFEVNLKTGWVAAEYAPDEVGLITDVLALLGPHIKAAGGPVPALPDVRTYYVCEYTQVYVTKDPTHGSYWVCSCADFRFARQSPRGELAYLNGACKHIVRARSWYASPVYSYRSAPPEIELRT